MIVAVDLFSGAGGLSEGLAAAGVEVAVAVELHPEAALTHACNHPGTNVLAGDIRKLCTSQLDQSLTSWGAQSVDVLAGGPPCQGFSTAGKKNASDPRNVLFEQYVRIVEHLQPRLLLLENVPGFERMHSGSAAKLLRERVSSLGYAAETRVLDAADYGVPQRRNRFVFVAWKCDAGITFQWPEPTHSDPGDCDDSFTRRLPSHVTASEALNDLDFLDPGQEAFGYIDETDSEYQAARRKNNDILFNHLSTRHRPKAVEMFRHIPPGGNIRSVPEGYRSEKRTMVRLHPHRRSNTVVSLPDDLLHYRCDRILTVRETARLQGFDDSFVFLGKRTSCNTQRRVDLPQYTQVGNAVPPLLARALGKSIVSMLGGKPTDLRDLDLRRTRAAALRGSTGGNGLKIAQSLKLPNLQAIPGTNIYLPHGSGEDPAQEPRIRYWRVRK